MFLTKENTQNMNLTGENLPKEFLDEIKTEKVEKIVRIHMTDHSKIYNKIQTKRQSVREKKLIGMQL